MTSRAERAVSLAAPILFAGLEALFGVGLDNLVLPPTAVLSWQAVAAD